MSAHTFIIRLENMAARDAFAQAVADDRRLAEVDLEFAEFLPDVIVREVDGAALAKLRQHAPDSARFMADVRRDLFSSGR